MAIRIKPIDQISKKYSSRASAASPDYTEGIKNPRRDQAEAAAAASDSYAQGVQQAIADNRFSKGVRKAGSDKWARKAATVGAQRYPSGVQAAVPDFQAGVQPYLDTVAGLTLPARMPKGDPGNIQRAAVVAQALRAKKLAGG